MHRLALVFSLLPALWMALLTLGLGAGVWSGCSGGVARVNRSPDEVGRERFETAIALPSRAYDVYWLGRGLTYQGLLFSGPLVAGFDDPKSDAVQLDYGFAPPGAGLSSTTGGALSITLMSSAHWDSVRDRVLAPGRDPTTSKDVTVGKAPATLITSPVPGRRASDLFLIIRLGGTVAYVNTGSLGSETPGGAETNPLVDEATFLAVMQNLRPYPQ